MRQDQLAPRPHPGPSFDAVLERMLVKGQRMTALRLPVPVAQVVGYYPVLAADYLGALAAATRQGPGWALVIVVAGSVVYRVPDQDAWNDLRAGGRCVAYAVPPTVLGVTP